MKIVFIVDDNETNLAVAKQALEGHYKTFAPHILLDRIQKLIN